MVDTDTTMVGALVRLTMNPTVSTMVAGDPATRWRRFAAVAIVQAVEAATQLRMLIDPHLLHALCHLYRRIVVAALVVAAVVVAAGDVKSFANRAQLGNKGVESTLFIFCRM
jgi:hypothetical protein